MATVRQPAFNPAFDADGLIPVVAQDDTTGDVLLTTFMNAEALERTRAEGILTTWSRTEGRLCRPVDQNESPLLVVDLRPTSSGESIIARVRSQGSNPRIQVARQCPQDEEAGTAPSPQPPRTIWPQSIH